MSNASSRNRSCSTVMAKHYELGVRIAVGYAVNDATDRDYADVFNRADRQMYLDKQEIKKTARATDYVDNR